MYEQHITVMVRTEVLHLCLHGRKFILLVLCVLT